MIIVQSQHVGQSLSCFALRADSPRPRFPTSSDVEKAEHDAAPEVWRADNSGQAAADFGATVPRDKVFSNLRHALAKMRVATVDKWNVWKTGDAVKHAPLRRFLVGLQIRVRRFDSDPGLQMQTLRGAGFVACG